MKSKRIWTFEEWKTAMEKACCSEWYKQDKHGECYYTYPEGSFEKENAWQFSFDESCQAMWDLPYSKELLLETIKIGCGNRMESVRYSSFLCVWLESKDKTLNSFV